MSTILYLEFIRTIACGANYYCQNPTFVYRRVAPGMNERLRPCVYYSGCKLNFLRVKNYWRQAILKRIKTCLFANLGIKPEKREGTFRWGGLLKLIVTSSGETEESSCFWSQWLSAGLDVVCAWRAPTTDLMRRTVDYGRSLKIPSC